MERPSPACACAPRAPMIIVAAQVYDGWDQHCRAIERDIAVAGFPRSDCQCNG